VQPTARSTIGGLQATRNLEQKEEHESGCSVVARALAECGINMSEQSVATVWTRRRAAHDRSREFFSRGRP
jgi:hypothetical protein